MSRPQVFIRELISNGSDALEKLRHRLMTEGKALPELEIHLQTDSRKGTITIQVTPFANSSVIPCCSQHWPLSCEESLEAEQQHRPQACPKNVLSSAGLWFMRLQPEDLMRNQQCICSPLVAIGKFAAPSFTVGNYQ